MLALWRWQSRPAPFGQLTRTRLAMMHQKSARALPLQASTKAVKVLIRHFSLHDDSVMPELTFRQKSTIYDTYDGFEVRTTAPMSSSSGPPKAMCCRSRSREPNAYTA
jgi:hypothetical protein